MPGLSVAILGHVWNVYSRTHNARPFADTPTVDSQWNSTPTSDDFLMEARWRKIEDGSEALLWENQPSTVAIAKASRETYTLVCCGYSRAALRQRYQSRVRGLEHCRKTFSP